MKQTSADAGLTPATAAKRADLLRFIAAVIAPEAAVKVVVGVGSIAANRCRPDSDIDAVVFMDPLDLYIVPAEALWDPVADHFYSIFNEDEVLNARGLQLDFKRVSWRAWCDGTTQWPEGMLAGLSAGWLAYDRDGTAAAQLAAGTAFPEALRQERLDEAVTWLDQHLNWNAPAKNWANLGPTLAHGRLQAAFSYLVEGLFAYNRRWLAFRNRRLGAMLDLPWLPPSLNALLPGASSPPGLDETGYQARTAALATLFAEFLAQLQASGDYGDDPIGEAFVRRAEEPGRSWNMAEWNEARRRRRAG